MRLKGLVSPNGSIPNFKKTRSMILPDKISAPPPPPHSYFPVGTDCHLYHAYWDGTAIDHSSYGNNGSLLPGASFVPNGVLISNAPTSGVDVDPTAMSFGTNPLSIFAWINKPNCDIDWQNLVCGEFGTDFNIVFKPGIISTFNTSGFSGDVSVSYNYADNWHLIGVHFDRTLGIRFSADGVYLNDFSSGANATNFAFNLEFTIGNFAPFIFGYDPLTGIIGEIYIHFTYKDDAYATTLFNATKAAYGV